MQIVTNWFKYRLAKLGYPNDEVHWSLGYCQGDGMAFSGYVNLKVAGSRLCPDIPANVWEFMEQSVKIETSGRYCHYNSMDLSMNSSDVIDMEPFEFGGVAKRVAMHRLLEVLEDDVKATSQLLEAEGYQLIEGTPFEDEVMMERKTASFRVVVTKFRDEHFDPHEYHDPNDLQYYDEDVQSILEGKTEYFGIKVEIFDTTDEDDDEGCLVAEHSLWGISADAGHRYASGMVREVVSEAVAEARKVLKMHQQASSLPLAA